MNKQAKIRKGLVDCLGIQVGAIPNDKVDNCYEIEPYWKGRLVTAMLDYLHENDAAIKVDRELPNNLIMKKQVESEQFRGETNWYYKAQLDMQLAGYVAVEPLI